jgi:hypothetical protein
MQGKFAECTLWLAKDHSKRIELRAFAHDIYELRFVASNSLEGCVEITQQQFRAVLHDYFHFEASGVGLTYDNRHVVVKVHGQRWASVPDVDLMRLENLALAGENESFDTID